MKQQQLAGIFCAAIFSLGLASAADASTIAPGVVITDSSGGASATYDGWTLGYTFDAISNSSVVSLGIWDYQDNGLFEAHDVGLWDSAGSLLASVTVASGTTDVLDSGYRWVELANSVSLLSGDSYTVAAYYDSSNNDLVADLVNAVSVDSRIDVQGSVQLQSGSLAYATSMVHPYNGNNNEFSYGGGNVMLVSAVPVPAAAWLFGSGLVGLAGVARRNRS